MTEVTRRDIAAAFRAAGAVRGDTVMFHGSLRSMGCVQGGAAAVIDGILDASSPGGTVGAATLWYNGNPAECRKEDFDAETSPTWTGLLAETLRKDPRSLRSNSFSHSVSAVGARARELTERHGEGRPYPSPWSEESFSEISPWSKFYLWNALYAFIGVDMDTCTMKHYIESRFVAELLDQLPPERYTEFRSQIAMDCKSILWIFYPGAQMRARLEEKGLVTKIPLGNTTLMTIRTRPLVDATLDILRAAPEAWCSPEFASWIARVKAARRS